ncbi:hypothetical protein HK405_010448 [Cladochytrium tenue]|nr:hypothetical protein HK405_010448 [Cladochytrium tenue]
MSAAAPITTHVLDTAAGRPAAGVPVRLAVQLARPPVEAAADSTEWRPVASSRTDADGRCKDLFGGADSAHLVAGAVYRLSFDLHAYYSAAGVHDCFFPTAEVHVLKRLLFHASLSPSRP